MNEHKPRIFLCHASEDKPRVAELYHKLKGAGYHPWLDKEDLLPGQDWRHEIEKIIRDPYNIVVVCLSCKSITKRGVVQREIKRALDVLDQMPEDTIYLIPVRLEDCQVPERLSQLHWVNLFEPDGFDKLKQALDFETSRRQVVPKPGVDSLTQQLVEPEMILIVAGRFLMGSDPKRDKDSRDYEQPQHYLYLPSYYLATTLVTNAQYAIFSGATDHHRPSHWLDEYPPKGRENHPVVNVSWHDALAYCKWLAEVTHKPYRLPSEAEWEKGARGEDGRIYPWGDQWDIGRCNSEESGRDGTTPVGIYPQGASPYGLLDMAGNVWEWTVSLWGEDWQEPGFKYPYKLNDSRENLKVGDTVLRVLRGGAFANNAEFARCAFRGRCLSCTRDGSIGFRVASALGS